MGNFYAENVSITSSDQAIFLGPGDLSSVHLRNVDLQYGAAPLAAGALLWLSDNAPTPTGSMDNVWVTALPSQPTWAWYDIAVWPKTDGYSDGGVTFPFAGWGTTVSADGNSVTFAAVDQISGQINFGRPPSGSFVSAASVGLNYKSPHPGP